MRLIFMGTPQFAVESLELLSRVHEIACVVTQPDRPKGRGHKLQPSPIKILAQNLKLPILQPEKIIEVKDKLITLQADVIVVVAYGQILPPPVLAIPKTACINLHASLLPKLRGAAPIQYALLHGESITGVTTMLMDAGLDTGNVLLQKEVPITDDMILPELQAALATTGANLLLKTLDNLPNIQATPQDNAAATYAPMITKDNALIDWNNSATTIHNQVRALYGSAFTLFNGGILKIWRTAFTSSILPAGTFKFTDKIMVGTADYALEITELQAPNARKISARDFINGLRG